MHDEDANKHICDINDLPIKGIEHKLNGQKIDIKTKLVID